MDGLAQQRVWKFAYSLASGLGSVLCPGTGKSGKPTCVYDAVMLCLNIQAVRCLKSLVKLLCAQPVVLCVDQEDAGCVYKVGIHAIFGAQQAYTSWNATFQDYLTDELYPQLNCSFVLVPLTTEDAVYKAVENASIDLLYTNGGLHVCLEVSNCCNECHV